MSIAESKTALNQPMFNGLEIAHLMLTALEANGIKTHNVYLSCKPEMSIRADDFKTLFRGQSVKREVTSAGNHFSAEFAGGKVTAFERTSPEKGTVVL